MKLAFFFFTDYNSAEIHASCHVWHYLLIGNQITDILSAKWDNWKCSDLNIVVFKSFFAMNQFLKGKLIIFIMNMCLLLASVLFLCDTYSSNINSSRAVTMLCLPISIDFLLWIALTTKSRNYKDNLRVWKVASCVYSPGWHSEKSVKGHLLCVIFHWDYKK